MHSTSLRLVIIIIIMGIRELSRGIGLWAMLEDAKELEDNQAVIEASGLLGRGQGSITMNK